MDSFGVHVAHLEEALDNSALGFVLQITECSQHNGRIARFVRLVRVAHFRIQQDTDYVVVLVRNGVVQSGVSLKRAK